MEFAAACALLSYPALNGARAADYAHCTPLNRFKGRFYNQLGRRVNGGTLVRE